MTFAKIGPGHEPHVPFARGLIFLNHFGAENVRRHQVGRELDAVELQGRRVRDGLDQQRLREARHAAQQAVAACEQAREHLAPHALLSDDLTADFLIQPSCEINGLVER